MYRVHGGKLSHSPEGTDFVFGVVFMLRFSLHINNNKQCMRRTSDADSRNIQFPQNGRDSRLKHSTKDDLNAEKKNYALACDDEE